MGPIQSIQELRDFLLRRRDILVLGVGLGILLGVFMALRSEPLYQSVAVLSTRVDAVADDTMRNTAASAQSRLLQLIEQRLTARDTMLRLANDYELFLERPDHERVDLMRQSITILSQAAVTVGFATDGSLASIVIQARADTARKAMDLANELAEMVMEETGAGRRARAEQTATFLSMEQERLQQALREVQAESRIFANENFEFTAFNVDMRRSEMTQIIADLQDARRELVAAEAELSGRNLLPRQQIAVRDRILALTSEVERLSAEQEAFQPFLRRVAEIEREQALLRDRESRLREQLLDVSRQLDAAGADLRLEADDRTARFEVVEPAEESEYPISRPRRNTAIMGPIMGLILATLAAFAYELARPALRSSGQVERELGMRPVLVLPELVLPAERRRMRRAYVAGVGLLVLALAAIILAMYGR